MYIEVDELLKCSFCLGPVYAGPISKISQNDGTMFYHELGENGSIEQDVTKYKQIDLGKVHPDNIPLIIKVREKLKSKYVYREPNCPNS